MRISDWSSDVCSSDLLPRAFLKNATPFIGTQWKVVTRAFCQFAVHHPSAARFKAFYRRSFIPDEAFFQTLMMNSASHGEVMNDDLRTIDWVPDRSEEHTSELQSLMRISYAVFCFKKKNITHT